MLNFITFSIYNICIALCFHYIYKSLYKVRVSFPKYMAGYSAFIVVSTIISFFSSIPMVNFSSSLIMILMLSFLYVGSIRSRMVSGFQIVCGFAIIETVVGSFLINVSFNINLLERFSYDASFSFIVMSIVAIALAKIYARKDRIWIDSKLNIMDMSILIISPILTILILSILLSANVSRSEVLSIGILLLLLDIFIFYIFDRLCKTYYNNSLNDVLDYQNRIYAGQIENLTKVIENQKVLSHDYKKHIIALKNYEKEDADEMIRYIENISRDYNISDIYSNSGNLAIDSIINYYLGLVENTKIECKIRIKKQLDFSEHDITVILGNLLENAINALNSIEDPNIIKKISVNINLVKEMLNISVMNTFDGGVDFDGSGLPINLERSSYGVKNINRIVEKYDGVLDFRTNKSLFIADIIIFDEE